MEDVDLSINKRDLYRHKRDLFMYTRDLCRHKRDLFMWRDLFMYVWHDSRVTWLKCEMTHAWHDSFKMCIMNCWHEPRDELVMFFLFFTRQLIRQVSKKKENMKYSSMFMCVTIKANYTRDPSKRPIKVTYKREIENFIIRQPPIGGCPIKISQWEMGHVTRMIQSRSCDMTYACVWHD